MAGLDTNACVLLFPAVRAQLSSCRRHAQLRILLQPPAVESVGLDPAVVETLGQVLTVPATVGSQFHINHATAQIQHRSMLGECTGHRVVEITQLLLITGQARRD